MTLVIGGGASGKSPFAEGLIAKVGLSPRLYIATMRPWDEECLARIARHQLMRKHKGFDTLECYEDLLHAETGGYPAVLLECLGNLLLNDPNREGILEGIIRLSESAEEFVIVSNDVFSDGGGYGEFTDEYVENLAWLHREIAKRAQRVIEMVSGCPIFHKGALR